MHTPCWEHIVRVHNEAKTLFILAEELEPKGHQTSFASILEQRHTLEHIIRAKANAFGDKPDTKYQASSLNKALGHAYRGFFDCADWLALILREGITDALESYNHEQIAEAIPAYYAKLRPRIEDISKQIAGVRVDKDVSNDDILVGVEQYKKIIAELFLIHRQVHNAIPSLCELRRSQRRMSFRKAVRFLLLAAVIGVVSFAWGRWTDKPQHENDVQVTSEEKE